MEHSWEYYVGNVILYAFGIWVLDRIPGKYRDTVIAVLLSICAVAVAMLIAQVREDMPDDWRSLIGFETYAMGAAFTAGALWYWLAGLRQNSPMAAGIIFWTVILFGAIGAGTIYLIA